MILPTEYDGKKITSISGVSHYKSIVGVIIPDGIIEISGNAFFGCLKLETVIMSDTVSVLESKGYGHFEECRGLKNIRLSRNLKELQMSFLKNVYY